MSEKLSAERRYNPEQLHELFLKREYLLSDKDERKSGLDLVKTGKNLYILGKPGAGKTTFLKNVAIQSVQGNIGGKSPEMMPFLFPYTVMEIQEERYYKASSMNWQFASSLKM